MYMNGFGVLGVGIEDLVTDTHETMNSNPQNIFLIAEISCHFVVSVIIS